MTRGMEWTRLRAHAPRHADTAYQYKTIGCIYTLISQQWSIVIESQLTVPVAYY